jgi:hypothetical protein
LYSSRACANLDFAFAFADGAGVNVSSFDFIAAGPITARTFISTLDVLGLTCANGAAPAAGSCTSLPAVQFSPPLGLYIDPPAVSGGYTFGGLGNFRFVPDAFSTPGHYVPIVSPPLIQVTISTTNLAVTPSSPWALPVPEPETYALMLAGLSLLGFAARGRKRHAA